MVGPINPGDHPRVYVVSAASSNEAGKLIGHLLDRMGYGNWPDHIAGFRAEGVSAALLQPPQEAITKSFERNARSSWNSMPLDYAPAVRVVREWRLAIDATESADQLDLEVARHVVRSLLPGHEQPLGCGELPD